jgi:flagellar motor switch/type III secretory pathway protein FliN
MDVPLEIEALIEGPRIRVGELLAMKAGNVIATRLPAGENVGVYAGHAALGMGELTAARGKVVVRMLRFQGDR